MIDNFTRFILLRSLPSTSGTGSGSGSSRQEISDQTSTSPSKSTYESISAFYLLDNPNRIQDLLLRDKPCSIGSLHSRPISPTVGLKRIYPHGIFLEMIGDLDRLVGREGEEGVLLLGSGPKVQLGSV